MKTKRVPYKDYIFKCEWHATALRLKVCGRDYWDAEKRLHTLLRHMEGGLEVKDIKFLGVT